MAGHGSAKISNRIQIEMRDQSLSTFDQNVWNPNFGSYGKQQGIERF